MSTDGLVSRPPETQIDRTRLSWRRTTLTATVVAALAIQELVGRGPEALRVVALVTLMVGWLGLVLLAERRIADMVDRGQMQAGRRPVVTVILILLMAFAGLWVSLLRG
jgi:hypothetical protein